MNKYEKKLEINVILDNLKDYCIIEKTKNLVNGFIIGIKDLSVNCNMYIDDLNILKRYCNDFQGREVKYKKINDNTVKMLINDAMEFLYTYTWGEQSYPLEVKEQFVIPNIYNSGIKYSLYCSNENINFPLCSKFTIS